MTRLSAAATLLAAYDPEDVKPGWIALVLILVLALATFLLWRSMNKQLGRIDVPTAAELREQRLADGGPARDARDGEDPPASPESPVDR